MKRVLFLFSISVAYVLACGIVPAQTNNEHKSSTANGSTQDKRQVPNVAYVADYQFSPALLDEGIELVKSVGDDMQLKQGYVSCTLIQDLKDPGHLVLVTRWKNVEEARVVLAQYRTDPKIKRLNELLPGRPAGFLGEVLR